MNDAEDQLNAQRQRLLGVVILPNLGSLEEECVSMEQMDAEARAYEPLATDAEAELNRQKAEFELKLEEIQVTGELLKCFDTDGSTNPMGSTKLTSKGQVEKTYQTPYGETRVKRHVYQSPKGGATFCPLERDARVIQGGTPKLAKAAVA